MLSRSRLSSACTILFTLCEINQSFDREYWLRICNSCRMQMCCIYTIWLLTWACVYVLESRKFTFSGIVISAAIESSFRRWVMNITGKHWAVTDDIAPHIWAATNICSSLLLRVETGYLWWSFVVTTLISLCCFESLSCWVGLVFGGSILTSTLQVSCTVPCPSLTWLRRTSQLVSYCCATFSGYDRSCLFHRFLIVLWHIPWLKYLYQCTEQSVM